MKRLVHSRLLAAMLVSFLAGCETPKASGPTAAASVALDPDVRRATVTTKVGTDLKLELPPPKEPGYVWTIMQNDTRYLRPLSEISAPAADTGISQVHFHALAVGRPALRLIAIPAGAGKETTPAEIYNVFITIEPPAEKKKS